jgi:DNA-binding NarL/FixJ family response regulator
MTYDELTAVEQQEVVRRLTARGASIRDIATQLSTTKRTVSRRRHLSAPRTLIAYLMPTG